jgi:hypothetical protein
MVYNILTWLPGLRRAGNAIVTARNARFAAQQNGAEA